MKQLVVVANDFGLCQSVNEGVLEACAEGIVTEVSLMLGSPGTNHALQIAREENITQLGICVALSHWQTTGAVARRADYRALLASQTADQLALLLNKEINIFEQIIGRPPTHITSRYGVLTHPKLWHTAVELAARRGIPMRLPIHTFTSTEPVMDPFALQEIRGARIQTTTQIFAHINGEFTDIRASFLKDLTSVQDGQSAEIMIHPGFTGAQLDNLSEMNWQRQRDVRLLVDPEFNQQLARMGFELSTYREAAGAS